MFAQSFLGIVSSRVDEQIRAAVETTFNLSEIKF
jgi:hypothetical protein